MIGDLFSLVSQQWDCKTFKCGELKTAYLAKFYLAPFIKKRLITHAADDDYIIMLDERLKVSIKKKQLDLHVQFWTTDAENAT